jgi:hypothetical protein
MHLICFNQYVDSIPDNHLDSSMLGKHNSVNKQMDRNLQSEHYNTQNARKLQLQYTVVLMRSQALWNVVGRVAPDVLMEHTAIFRVKQSHKTA